PSKTLEGFEMLGTPGSQLSIKPAVPKREQNLELRKRWSPPSCLAPGLLPAPHPPALSSTPTSPYRASLECGSNLHSPEAARSGLYVDKGKRGFFKAPSAQFGKSRPEPYPHPRTPSPHRSRPSKRPWSKLGSVLQPPSDPCLLDL
ncbi:hypothetical protein P7K49_033424, partial [Saguinus oedipus]